MNSTSHWEAVYGAKSDEETSWHAAHLATSLALIRDLVAAPDSSIIDVGAGTSTLIDDLLEQGFTDLSAADLSAAALEKMKARLGERASSVTFLVGDVTALPLPLARFSLWHDRAVFHFLVDEADRQRYADQVARAVRPGGHVVMATFAPDGPERCSGLPVRRYDERGLAAELGERFELVKSTRETHITPWGAEQPFVYCAFARR